MDHLAHEVDVGRDGRTASGVVDGSTFFDGSPGAPGWTTLTVATASGVAAARFIVVRAAAARQHGGQAQIVSRDLCTFMAPMYRPISPFGPTSVANEQGGEGTFPALRARAVSAVQLNHGGGFNSYVA